jgi:hypothetical protein
MSDAQDVQRLALVSPRLVDMYERIKPQFALQFPGSHISIAQGYRTPAMQTAAHLDGASPFDGSKSHSKHQMFPAMAIDIAVIENEIYVSDGMDLRYSWLGDQFESEGAVWGGSFIHVQKDYDHFELPGPQPTAAQVIDSYTRFKNNARPTTIV